MPPIPLGSTVLYPMVVTAPSGASLYGSIHRPLGNPLRPKKRPAVVLLPGGMGAGRLMARGRVGTILAKAGMVVASFNAEGRSGGFGDRRSGGTPNFNGFRDQDGLAAVIRHLAAEPDVDAENLGLASVSFGLVAATGALARHRLPVAWLVDEEGPADCFSAMLKGWRVHDLGERPDRAQKAIELFGHDCPTGPGPDADFWAERAPVRFLPAFGGRYLRLQAEYDHVQPPHEAAHVPLFDRGGWWQGRHAVQLVNAAVGAGLPWVRVNLPAQGNPVGATFDETRRPRWLPGKMADRPEWLADAVLEMAGYGVHT